MPDFNKAGLLVVRDNRILLCRKKYTTSLLILPGGCFESGETAEQCIAREVREELGDVKALDLRYVGTYSDWAAGADDKIVRVELYAGMLDGGEPLAQSEIKELVWFGEKDDRELLSPSLRNKILPDLIARGLLPWGDALQNE